MTAVWCSGPPGDGCEPSGWRRTTVPGRASVWQVRTHGVPSTIADAVAAVAGEAQRAAAGRVLPGAQRRHRQGVARLVLDGRAVVDHPAHAVPQRSPIPTRCETLSRNDRAVIHDRPAAVPHSARGEQDESAGSGSLVVAGRRSVPHRGRRRGVQRRRATRLRHQHGGTGLPPSLPIHDRPHHTNDSRRRHHAPVRPDHAVVAAGQLRAGVRRGRGLRPDRARRSAAVELSRAVREERVQPAELRLAALVLRRRHGARPAPRAAGRPSGTATATCRPSRTRPASASARARRAARATSRTCRRIWHGGQAAHQWRGRLPLRAEPRRPLDRRAPTLRRRAHRLVHRAPEDRSRHRPHACVRLRVHRAVPVVLHHRTRRHDEPRTNRSTSRAAR